MKSFKDLVISTGYKEVHSDELGFFVLNHKYFNSNVTEYLNKFYSAHGILIDNIKSKELIISSYWKFALILYKHHKNETGWSKSSINEYINIVRRILELMLYVAKTNLKELNSIYFDYDDIAEHDNYYFFLIKLSNGVANKIFKIIDGKYHNVKSHRNFVCLNCPNDLANNKIENKYVFHPIGKHTLKGPSKEVGHLEYYFKTKKDKANVVYRIFSLDESQGRISGKSKGGLVGKHLPLKTFEIVNYIKPDLEISKIAEETIKEVHLNTSKETLSPLLDSECARSVDKDFYNVIKTNSIEACYKRFLINNAISNSYIYKNINLETTYNKPSLPICKEFVKYLINSWSNSYFVDLIILSLILGIPIEKLIYSILDLDDTFTYKKIIKSNSKLNIKINKSYFAEFTDVIDNKLSYKVEQEGEVYLTDTLEKKWLNIKSNLEKYVTSRICYEDLKIFIKESPDQEIGLSEKTIHRYVEKCKELQDFDEIKKYVSTNFSKRDIDELNKLKTLEYYINDLIKNNIKIYTKHVKSFHKNIKVNLKNLHTLFYYYYKVYNSVSDIQLLFTQNISKNDEARLTYCNSLKRLLVYEKWIYNFTIYLGLDEYLKSEASEHQLRELNHYTRIGSRNYIKDYKFREFMINLDKLNIDDEIIKLNIRMIYLRYAFSILLVSRDFIKTSSDLSQISKRFKIITIQEKGKNLYQGKRILPLTNKAIAYIDMFQKIKKQYSISSESPILLSVKNGLLIEKPITKSNVNQYLDSLLDIEKDPFKNHENTTIINDIKKFTSYTSINFGRHVVTTQMVQKGVCSEYIDAIMNHHQLGKEDQGKYSNFDTLKYVNEARIVLEDIESKYFSVCLGIEDDIWN